MMKTHKYVARGLIVGSIYLISACPLKTRQAVLQPEEGLEGKDVPWIGTPQALVDDLLSLAQVTPEDYLIDLGSGDGRAVISAAKLGATALGIEYNSELGAMATMNAEREAVSHKTEFIEADLLEYDFSKATVIFMFLLPEINMKLRAKLLDLEPGTRIVSNTFTMQEWAYDEAVQIADDLDRWNKGYMWI